MRAEQNSRSRMLQRILTLVAAILILKVTLAVIAGYRDYFPPNFDSDFLNGREAYFFGSYQWAFYTHILSSPGTLIVGLILISDKFRLRFPVWHRSLGRLQVLCVLLLVTPSGLWMAYYAAAGRVGGVALALLAFATATCVALGWSSAVKRRFAEHRRWMLRSYILLCSAVVLRIIGGMGTVLGVDALWYDPVANWVSWVVPLTAFELYSLRNRLVTRRLAATVMVSRGA